MSTEKILEEARRISLSRQGVSETNVENVEEVVSKVIELFEFNEVFHVRIIVKEDGTIKCGIFHNPLPLFIYYIEAEDKFLDAKLELRNVLRNFEHLHVSYQDLITYVSSIEISLKPLGFSFFVDGDASELYVSFSLN